MNIIRYIVVFIIAVTLVSCEDNLQTDEPITLELVGDDTVRIEEGTEYEDLGILVNGEQKTSISYYSTVNPNVVGTYYVKYEYEGQEIIRTVEVIAGPKSELIAIIESFEASTNYTYSLILDVRFTRGDSDFHTFIYEQYDVDGPYLHGTVNHTSATMNEYTQDAYIYIDIANKVVETYAYDEHSFWYYDNPYYSQPTSLVTDFSLSGIKSVTKEMNGDQIIYQGFLNFEDYIAAYHSKVNLIPDEHFLFEVDDYVGITIIVENDQIIEITVDMLDVMKGALNESSDATITEYFYHYTFENYNQVEELSIPEEGIDARRLHYPDSTGSGTLEDPYIITDEIQFLTIHDNLDKHYQLGQDIDLSGMAWMPFGFYNLLLGQSPCFTGTLDGNGYAIQNMNTFGELNIEQYGLFTCIDGTNGGGVIRDLRIENVDLYLHDTNTDFSVGIVAGEIINGKIEDISIEGTITVSITITNGLHYISMGGLAGTITNGCTLSNNTYNLDMTLRTNLSETNYVIHEVVGTGQEYLSTYISTSTITIDVIE